MRQQLSYILAILIIVGMKSQAATYYVVTNGPFGDGSVDWAHATNDLQGAITKAGANDTVLVSNGVYETGGMANYPAGTFLTNRIVIDEAITVKSANNDPTNTIIKGRFDTGEPGAADTVTNGPAAVRCVYMADGSSLIGFTLTNGATLVIGSDNYGAGVLCPSVNATISNCVIVGNVAVGNGGGAGRGTLYNCMIVNNTTKDCGGGAAASVLYNCTIISNKAVTVDKNGGGIKDGYAFNCTLIGNWAHYGAGAENSIMSNCLLTCNTAGDNGGGADGWSFTLYNCTLVGNTAGNSGGGLNGGTLYNCTIVSNKATGGYGGGVSGLQIPSTLYNCIVYFNTAALNNETGNSNWTINVTFINCCTAPTTTVWAAGNITANPMFVGMNTTNYRLSANSPCINTGTNQSWMTGAVDPDGRTRIRYGTVDMGAYEFILSGTMYGVH